MDVSNYKIEYSIHIVKSKYCARWCEMKFNPCKGSAFCTEEGTHCEGCGRSHVEIAETKALVNGLVEFVQKQEYENTEDFAQFISGSLVKKIQKIRSE